VIYDSVLETIGNTPIVKLNNIVREQMANIYVKMERFNPGGSVKDRIALSMIETAEQQGLIKPGDTLVEPTSGNTGIGLALVAAAKGYDLVLTMPESMSLERRKLLKAYGAKLELTRAQLGMSGAIERAVELSQNEGYYMLQQFENHANPEIHRKTTALEIYKDFGQDLDVLVLGVGTGGTITGVGEILKQYIPGLRVVALEPKDSPVLSGGNPGPHLIQGIGAGFIPGVLNKNVYDEIIKIDNKSAIETTQMLAHKEGIMVGISSGAAVYGALVMADRLGKGKNVLTLAPDTGERYLSLTLFE